MTKNEYCKNKLKEKWSCMDSDKKSKIKEKMFSRFHQADPEKETETEKEE